VIEDWPESSSIEVAIAVEKPIGLAVAVLCECSGLAPTIMAQTVVVKLSWILTSPVSKPVR
jgi:hypothetical protein